MNDAAVYAILSVHTGLTALVGARVYPLVAPQNTGKPYVTYQLVAGDPLHTLGTDPGDGEALYQVDCWATDNPGAIAVAAQVKAALKDYTGEPAGVTVDRIVGPEDQRSEYEPDTKLFRRSLDFRIFYQE